MSSFTNQAGQPINPPEAEELSLLLHTALLCTAYNFEQVGQSALCALRVRCVCCVCLRQLPSVMALACVRCTACSFGQVGRGVGGQGRARAPWWAARPTAQPKLTRNPSPNPDPGPHPVHNST